MTTITAYNSLELADQINEAFAADATVKVNGYTLKSRWGSPVARSWGNGTVSITVPARKGTGTNDIYFKVGATVQIGA